MNELNLPPYRDLPEPVEARLTTRVHDAIAHDGKRRRFARFTPALAAAAAIALGGGVIVAGNLSSNTDRDDGPHTADLDRCWNAIEHADKADEYPHRDTWRVINYADDTRPHGALMGDSKLLVIRGDDGPVFCALTPTTVTLAPAEAPSTTGPDGVQPMLWMPGGPVAGVSGTRDKFMLIQSYSHTGPGLHADARMPHRRMVSATEGTFLAEGIVRKDPPPMMLGTYPDERPGWRRDWLPSPPEPAVRYVDHPELVGERSSEHGKALESCLRIPDRDAYHPGAMIVTTGGRHVVFWSDDRFGECWGGNVDKSRVDLVRDHPDQDNPVMLRIARTESRMRSVILFGSVAPGVARLSIGGENDTQVDTDIHQGTFAALVRFGKAPLVSGPSDIEIPAKAFADDGSLLWEGTLKLD